MPRPFEPGFGLPKKGKGLSFGSVWKFESLNYPNLKNIQDVKVVNLQNLSKLKTTVVGATKWFQSLCYGKLEFLNYGSVKT